MYDKQNLQFTNIADINTSHYLVWPQVDPIIKDILQRNSTIRARIATKPEGTETFRWVEQTGLARNAGFTNPRTLAPVQTNAPTRVEKLAKLKAVSNRITYGLFDTELTKNGTFSYVLEKDMKDMLTDMILLCNDNIWSGNDTSYGTPTQLGYFGLLTAITNTGSVASGQTISKAIKAQVATMMARTDLNVLPTAVYMNPLTVDYMENEENMQTDKIKFYDVEVTPGTTVSGIMTAAGILPIVPDNRIPVTDTGSAYAHKIVLLDEQKVVRHYLAGYGEPVVFKLGTVESLITDYVAVLFDNVVCQFPDVAHCILTKTVAK